MLAVSATAPLGWAQAIEGDPAGGASLLRDALARWTALGSQAAAPLLLGLLAEAEQLAGQPEEALRVLDDALAQIDRSGERYLEAEFHRLKGESLLTVSPPQPAAAEAAFTTSIAVARRQGAKLLEERTAASLGRLRAQSASSPPLGVHLAARRATGLADVQPPPSPPSHAAGRSASGREEQDNDRTNQAHGSDVACPSDRDRARWMRGRIRHGRSPAHPGTAGTGQPRGGDHHQPGTGPALQRSGVEPHHRDP
jgi:hypothetical protein